MFKVDLRDISGILQVRLSFPLRYTVKVNLRETSGIIIQRHPRGSLEEALRKCRS